MTVDAETTDLVRATIKECVKAEVRRLVHDNLSVVLLELLTELRGNASDASGYCAAVLQTVSCVPYVADPVTPVCEGYVCGHTHTSLSVSEVELDFEGVVLVDKDTIHTHMAMCQLTDTIVMVRAAEVPDVCARHQVTDVVYFHEEHTDEATKLCGSGHLLVNNFSASTAVHEIRTYLDRRNTAFVQTLLQPDSGSVAVEDIHKFLCRLPSDVCTSLFVSQTDQRMLAGLPPSITMSADTPAVFRKEEDEVAILAHHCIPVVDGRVHGYRLRHTLGGANAAMEQTMPADFVSSAFSRIEPVVAEWVYGKEMIEKKQEQSNTCGWSSPIAGCLTCV